MGLMDRAKAAALVVKAKGMLKKELPKVEPRAKKWTKLIEEAEAKNNSKLEGLAKKAKDAGDDYAVALEDMDRLVKKVKLVEDTSDKIKEFTKGMGKAEEKADDAYGKYKTAKTEAMKLVDRSKEEWDDRLIRWLADDSPGWATMKKLFTDLVKIQIG
jgi:hypothetical protein